MSRKIEVKTHSSVSGEYSFVRRGPGGELRGVHECGVSPNLITNFGLDAMATTSTYLANCYVGSGTTAPQFTDTQLTQLIASNSSVTTYTTPPTEAEGYRAGRVRVFRFGMGVAAGNLSEVGVGQSATGLFSKALILDALGNPTTITVLPDETLDVIYTFYLYPKLTDDTGTFDLTGNLAGTYSYTFRSCRVSNTITQGGSAAGWGIGPAGERMDSLNNPSSGPGGGTFYAGDIGPVTGAPSGFEFFGTSPAVALPYVAGSHSITIRQTSSPTQGNVGLTRSMTRGIGPCVYQVQFDPPIPKDASSVLVLDFSHSWGRA